MTAFADIVYQLGGLPSLPTGLPFGSVGSNYFFVDGVYGSDGNKGTSPSRAFKTIQKAFTVNAGAPNALVFVLPNYISATNGNANPYVETVIMDAPSSALIGVSRGRTQGGLPQIRSGAGSTPLITIKAPGCLVTGLGFNGGGGTMPGILLKDDQSTMVAFGTTITNNHFQFFHPSATLATAGGAVTIDTTGAVWDLLISNNRFHQNTSDVCLLGTSNSVPNDVIIEGNQFSGPAASVSANVYLAAGSGVTGLVINNNVFPCFPSAGGTNAPVNLTGCTGVLTNNTFGCSGKTFGAAANVLVPTTVLMANNYQEGGTTQITRT